MSKFVLCLSTSPATLTLKFNDGLHNIFMLKLANNANLQLNTITSFETSFSQQLAADVQTATFTAMRRHVLNNNTFITVSKACYNNYHIETYIYIKMR